MRLISTTPIGQVSNGPNSHAAEPSNMYVGHARFHNGQTMSMGVCLCLGTLWKTWWDNSDNLLTASVFASLYYITQFSAFYYPGATAYDPPQAFFINYPHVFVVGPNLAMIGLAYWLEQRRVRALNEKKTA